jgi:2,5-dihydroxypyridine 5,6-dioxygenase
MARNSPIMSQPNLEPARGHAFENVLARCGLKTGDTVAALSESQSRPVLPELTSQADGVAVAREGLVPA